MFVRRAFLPPDTLPPADRARWPYALPVVAGLVGHGIEFPTPVTLLAGDNGTGKSTLVEAVAVAAGFNPEGGSASFRFATRATESPLGEHLVLQRTPGRKPRTGYFLRAESYYNVATEIERLDADPDSPPLLGAYGAPWMAHRCRPMPGGYRKKIRSPGLNMVAGAGSVTALDICRTVTPGVE